MNIDTARQILRKMVFISGYMVLGIAVACAHIYWERGMYDDLGRVFVYAGLVVTVLSGYHIFTKRLNTSDA